MLPMFCLVADDAAAILHKLLIMRIQAECLFLFINTFVMRLTGMK